MREEKIERKEGDPEVITEELPPESVVYLTPEELKKELEELEKES
jgi:hypothetical protein